MLPWRENFGLVDMVRRCNCSGKEQCCASDTRFTPKGLMDHLNSKKKSCFLHLGIYLYLYTIYRGLRGTGHKALVDVGNDEYKKAGFNLMPMGQKNKKAVVQIIIYTVCLIIVSVIPVLKRTGAFYIHPITAIIIALLGLSMLYYGVLLHKKQTNIEARKLMLSSVIYITMIQIIYVIDKFLH